MTASSLDQLTLTDAAAAIGAGRLSAVELAEHFLARIERLNPVLNAFITVTADRARAAAWAARVGSGPAGPLRGLPLALKDLFDTAGVRTTAGSTILAENVPVRTRPRWRGCRRRARCCWAS